MAKNFFNRYVLMIYTIQELAPDWFREEVKDEIVRMNARYA